MENMYLLVEDSCNMDNDVMAHMDYVYFGTMEEVRDQMKSRYQHEKKHGWDHAEIDWNDPEPQDSYASLWDDNDSYDCHICWWVLECGPKPDHGGMYLVVKGHALEGGGIEVNLCGAYTDDRLATQRMMALFGAELAHPSFYSGWDPDYCELDGKHALATVETMDEVIQFDVITVFDWRGEAINHIYRHFEYIG